MGWGIDSPMDTNGHHPPELKKAAIEFKANQIRQILDKVDRSHWRTILEEAGVKRELDALAPKPKPSESNTTPGTTLADATEDDLAVLDKMALEAMKAGMNPRAPNAQMVRAYHNWRELKEGEEQLKGLEIVITPHEIPDKMAPDFRKQLAELTKIASDS